MPKVVLDTTVLVSALLNPVEGGASYDLLRQADEGSFELILSDDILEETAQVLLTGKRLRQRYRYADEDVVEYCREPARFAAEVLSDVPEIRVVRDPNDDMILACAIASDADVLVSRDKDLLSLGSYEGVAILTPEDFLGMLRKAGTDRRS